MGGRTWDRSSSFPKTKAWGQGCSGGSRGGPPLFLDQNVARRAEKFFRVDAPPPPLCQGLDGRPPPPTPSSEGLDPPLGCFCGDPPLYVRAWMIAAPPPTPSSEGLDPPLGCHHSLSLVQTTLVRTYAMD